VSDDTTPTEPDDADDSAPMPQEFYDLFEAVDNGDGTQDQAAHQALADLEAAGLGPEAFA
jgi:hypothetical protein